MSDVTLLLVDSSACLVMELAELGDLYSILKDKRKYPDLSWERRIRIAIDTIKGLICLHYRNPPILHRDMKSLNVLLRKDWSAFICDFGFARIKETTDSLGTKDKGTGLWMAPEMHQKDVISSPALDVYSFGMVMFELLTRQIPFYFDGLSSTGQVIVAISRGDRPKIPSEEECPSVKDCPTNYVELMQDCWDQDPAKRPRGKNILLRLELILQVCCPVNYDFTRIFCRFFPCETRPSLPLPLQKTCVNCVFIFCVYVCFALHLLYHCCCLLGTLSSRPFIINFLFIIFLHIDFFG